MDPDAVDDVGGVRNWQHVVADRIAVSWWTEGRAACCHFSDTALARFDADIFRVYEHCLELEKFRAGNAGTDPAVVLIDTSRSPQDFSDNVLEVPVGAAAVLKAEIGFYLVEAVGRVDDGRIAVDQASHC